MLFKQKNPEISGWVKRQWGMFYIWLIKFKLSKCPRSITPEDP